MRFVKNFLLLLIIVVSQSVFAHENYSADTINQLASIERSIFGRTDTEYDFETRLKNAERKVFGAVQSGDFDSRINLLTNVLESSNQNYYSSFNSYKVKSNTPLKIIRNALIQRQGVLTGFTPSPYPVNIENQNRKYRYNMRRHKNIPPHRRRTFGGINRKINNN